MSLKLKIWIALLVIYSIWGSTYLAILFAVETIPPFLITGTRFLLAGATLYLWRRLAGDPAPTRG
jgi:drug/metabolite transporter (DMT)-like permease